MTRKINVFLEHFFQWVGKHNWYVVGALTIGMTVFEIFEIVRKRDTPTDPFHIIELIVYVAILLLLGVLVSFLVQANIEQTRIMKILKHKHDVSLKLIQLEDWNALIAELVKLPGTITTIERSRLFVHNSASGEFEEVAQWSEDGKEYPDFHHSCRECLKTRSESGYIFSLCSANSTLRNNPVQSQEYCLPINDANGLLVLIQFRLKAGETLSKDHIEIFTNMSPEIALALKASQVRKAFADMRMAETALAERHSVSTYLHDHLSQNLAYLCLKLEQYIANEGGQEANGFKQIEFKHMREAANQSYEILRDMLETMHPETTPCLTNLFNEHAKKVSERAHFEVQLEKKGNDLPLLPEVQRAIFYVFREALSNIEKHAHANKVKVLLDWDSDCIDVSILDDGIGFDPQSLNGDKHFGLEIMQERIDKVGGQINFYSSMGSGTEITLSVPIVSNREGGRL